jgi:hypothetical protein
MSLLEPVADVTEIAQAQTAASARRVSHAADKTDEITSLDRVSRHLLPGGRDDLSLKAASNTTRSIRSVKKLTLRRRVLALSGPREMSDLSAKCAEADVGSTTPTISPLHLSLPQTQNG